MSDPTQQKKGWLDTTISLQWIVGGFVAGLIGLAGIGITWASDLQKGRVDDTQRIARLENNDREQEKHFSRIEGALGEQKNDTREQLRSISQDIKDLGNKVDQLKEQTIANSVANRPEIQKWSRP